MLVRWSDMDDLLAADHRIGYTDVMPEVPARLPAEAKDFVSCCFKRHASARPTAVQLVAHRFVAAARGLGARPAKQELSADWCDRGIPIAAKAASSRPSRRIQRQRGSGGDEQRILRRVLQRRARCRRR